MNARRNLYRSRRGAILGVCRGLAEHLDVPVAWVRIAAVALFFMTGVWPAILIYLVAAMMLTPEPARPIETVDEKEFYESYVNSRSQALQRLRRTYDRVERRVQRMEDAVTSREFEWDRKFRQS